MSESKITKNALAESLKLLMQTIPFAKISVNDICEHCGISRKSFYYHFKDKYDLVNWIFYSEYMQILADKDYDDGWSCLFDIYDYLYHNKDFYIKAFAICGQNSLRSYFCQIIQPYLTDIIKKAGLADQDNVYFDFFTDMCLMSTIHWLEHNPHISPTQFLALEKAAVEGIVASSAEELPGTKKNNR